MVATDPDDILDRLERIAGQLAKLTFPTSPINVADAHWLAGCLEAYLSGNVKSTDVALGLVAMRGGQRKQRHRELICQVWAELQNATADAIAHEVYRRYPNSFPRGIDEKQVRRAVGSVPGKLDKLTPEAINALGVEISRRMAKGG